MRPLSELINTKDPYWPTIRDSINKRTNAVEVLPKEGERADSALYQAQVTTRSPLGAVIYETGGILIDSGWIRILGSGCARLDRSVMEWNKGKTDSENERDRPYLLIADDAVGGFYAINYGGISHEPSSVRKVFYFPADKVRWEPMNMNYAEFLNFCIKGDIRTFYKALQWKGWQREVAKLDGNQVIQCEPFLFSKEGRDPNKDKRKAVPIEELWQFEQSVSTRLELK
jgi:hypothetical protein